MSVCYTSGLCQSQKLVTKKKSVSENVDRTQGVLLVSPSDFPLVCDMLVTHVSHKCQSHPDCHLSQTPSVVIFVVCFSASRAKNSVCYTSKNLVLQMSVCYTFRKLVTNVCMLYFRTMFNSIGVFHIFQYNRIQMKHFEKS